MGIGDRPAHRAEGYAQTRADIQTERTYGSIAATAMKWVPLLNIVLTTLFYALFPVLFPLFLLPRTGPAALKGYVTGFFYLAAWGPLCDRQRSRTTRAGFDRNAPDVDQSVSATS